VFSSPIAIRKGEIVERDGFVFADVAPEHSTIDESPRGESAQ
jgi:hypothetical protein